MMFRLLSIISFIVFVSIGVNAQDLSGIHVGDNISAAIRLHGSFSTSQAGPFMARKWKLADGNDLSVTATAGGTVMYVETDWRGNQGGSYSDFPGFYYGRTTLVEIRKRLGSNGFTFNDRIASPGPDGSIVMFNSYEIIGLDNTIVTFVTKIDRKDFPAARAAGPGLYAKLVGVVLGYPEYLRNIWGSQLTFDPAYQKIQWR
jgi:hypothetical protein